MNYYLRITNLVNFEKMLELQTNDFEFAKKVFFELGENLIKTGFDLQYPYLKNGHLFIAKSIEKSIVAKLTNEK